MGERSPKVFGDAMALPAVFELIRPHNCLLAGLAVLVGAIVAVGWSPPPSAALAFLVAAVVCGGGNAINDYFDREVDAINRPGRPIPSGRLAAPHALIIACLMLVGGTLLAILINPACFALAALNSLLLVLYTAELKRRGLVGNITIGYLVGSTFLFGGLAVGPLQAVGVLASMAALSTVGRELIKDVEDMPGDREIGLRTLPLTHGVRVTTWLAAVFIAAAIALSPLPLWLGIFGGAYLALVLIAIAFFVSGAVLVIKEPGVRSASRASLACKVGMGFGLLAFLAGAI